MMKNDLNQFLGNISKETFLKNYWNKKPLFIKNAFSNTEELASFEDLFEFANDEDFESRIIYENDGRYSVKDGPVHSNDLKGQYTFICHALNLFNDDFKYFEQMVTSFIPHWQFDDVMATISNKGSSVGAHTDHYGVFILQGSGKREWFIQENAKQEFQEGLEVKILKEFNPEYSHVLEPGDMIYIPPLCAHHGVSLEDSISYSIGFKAFELENILKDYLYDFGENFESSEFYLDDNLRDPFELNDHFVDFFHKKITTSLNDKSIFKSWLASFLSSSRYPADASDNTNELAMDMKFTYYKTSEGFYTYLNNKFEILNESQIKELKRVVSSNNIEDLKDPHLKEFLLKSGAIL